jgi:hypothetical protein
MAFHSIWKEMMALFAVFYDLMCQLDRVATRANYVRLYASLIAR